MTPTKTDIEARLELARRIAKEAGAITLKHFQRDDLEVERKEDQSPVTVADRAAEVHMRAVISEAFPQDGILGEEGGVSGNDSDDAIRWILDPIDGTKSFIHGVPLYTTLIGVLHRDEPILGLIYVPALDEMIYAAVGGGAWFTKAGSTPRRAKVSNKEKLRDSLVCTSEIGSFGRRGKNDATNHYVELQRNARLSRTWGDGYGYMMVALGRADAMVDPIMQLWDAAAVAPVVREAGGSFTDWNGNATVHGGEGAATNGKITAEVLSYLKH